jgi:PhnB protein
LFDGECEEAFKIYEKCLGGKIQFMMTFGASPMANDVPEEWRGKVMHAALVVDGVTLMGSDAPPGRYEAPKGFSVSLGIKDPAEADRIFNELSANGKIQMPIQKTFWAIRFAMFVDRFGIPWIVNCEQVAEQTA